MSILLTVDNFKSDHQGEDGSAEGNLGGRNTAGLSFYELRAAGAVGTRAFPYFLR